MLEIAIKAYKETDIATLEGLQIMDLEVNRLCNFCLRQINKEQYISAEQMQQSHTLYYLIEILEELGDVYKRMARNLAESKKKNNELIKIMQLLLEQNETAYSYFYKSTQEKANSVYNIFNRIDGFIKEVLGTKLLQKEILSIYSIIDSTRILNHFITMRLDFLRDEQHDILKNSHQSIGLDYKIKRAESY
jgi:hypothetical protein